MFKYIVGFSSFLIASIAAFFSIKGISLLFSGSFWPVVLMASALEVGKLVATSSLYRYFQELNKLIKIYLFVAIGILMAITSLGIFGFLSDAFYRSKLKSEATSAKVMFIEEKKNSLQQKFDYNKERIKTLSEIRKSQEDRLSAITKQNTDVKKSGIFGTDQSVDASALKAKSKNIDLVTSEVQSANKEIDELSKNNEIIMQEMDTVNNQLLEIKQIETKETDIGTFKFIAKAFNVELDTAVKYFIISLVCVFDPLAVILLIIFNFLIKKK